MSRTAGTNVGAQDLPRRGRWLVCGQLWLLDVALAALLCGAYVDRAQPETWLGQLFVHGGRLSCAASLSLVPGLLSLAAAALVRSRAWLAWLAGSLWSAGLLLLYVDTRLYGIFRYHFNGLVWNVLTTPGADEAVHLSPREVALVLGVALALVPLHAGVFGWLWNRALRRRALALPTPRAARPTLAWSLLLVPNMLVVAGVYAWADLARDPQVMAFARVYPLYPRLTVKRLAQRYFGVALTSRPRVDLPERGILLDYPHAPVELAPGAPRPNLLLVVVDSLRADMLAPEVMPRTSALARAGRTYRDHLSSGNATRFGLFGLLYGLHGSYWKAVSDEHRSPVLIDALLAAGYDLRVLTSASMEFPEFRSTAWVRVEDRVEDEIPAPRPGARDDGVAARFAQWLSARDAARPFFAFLLLDAPHQAYAFPPEEAPFRPFVDEVSYATLDDDAPEELRAALFNRYRNSVHYADGVVGRILEELERHGGLARTLVLVTGDHGEEFFESGVWGHTSNFTRAQVHVPLVLAGAHVPPGEETRPTSHIDVPATLLELLGADPAVRASWSLGANLLAPPAQRARVVSGWDTLGVHLDGAILEVPMAGHGGTEIAVYDLAWRRRFDDADFLSREGPTLGNLALECRRFLR